MCIFSSLESSYFQMKGTQGSGATSILIRGVVNEKRDGRSAETLELSSSSVLWNLEDGEVNWEEGEVRNKILIK